MSNDRDIASQVGQVASKTAKAGVAIGKATAKGASGNVVGAAFELAKDETTRKVIIIAIVVALILPTLAAAAIPMTVFGALEGFSRATEYALADEIGRRGDNAADVGYDIPSYMERGYSSNQVINEPYEYSLSNIITSIFNFFAKRDAGEDEIEAVLTDDLYHVGGYQEVDGEGAEDYSQTGIISYLDLILERYAKRRSQYEKMLEEIETSFKQTPHPGYWSSGCDEYRVDPSIFESPMLNREDALSVMAVYSIQRGNNGLMNLDPKSIVGWLGAFNDLGANTDSGYFCVDRFFATKKWDGDALPQYAYEELQQQQMIAESDPSYAIPNHARESFAFIPETYVVDKQTGIVANTNVEYEERTAEDGSTYIVSIFVVEITMTATFKSLDEMCNGIIGFWDGSFETGSVSPKEGANANWDKLEWVGLDGRTYSRQYEYQISYVNDLITYTRQYLGDIISSSSEGWMTVGYMQNGTYVSIDVSSIPYNSPDNAYIQAMVSEGLSKQGARYSDFGFYTDWCAYFVSWLANRCGLSNLFYGSSPIGSTWVYWNHFGGHSNYNRNLTNGTNSYGSCIVYQDTCLGGGEYIPQTGDLIVFSSTSSPGQTAHIGMVYSYDEGTNDLFTIEGNTGASHFTQSSVRVQNRTNGRKYGSNYNAYNIIGFIHPNYPT